MVDNLFTAKPSVLTDHTIKEYLELQRIKPQELHTINRLCQALKKGAFYHHIFEKFYLNYLIPQIGKEFDLLRIGEELIVNIELKSEKIDDIEILKQLERNHYYLSFLQKTIYCYTFITDGDNNKLYYYDKENHNIHEVDINSLYSILNAFKDIDTENIDNLFVPSNYLISPFNTTERFINDEYFLTKHQEQIKSEVIKKISNNHPTKVFSISGSAGTGKTLTTYDIAKELKKIGQNVIIVHCAQINNGINKLRTSYGWNILPINSYRSDTITSTDILIIDEAQRLTTYQLENILLNKNTYMIFSHDSNQKLNRANQAEAVVRRIESTANQNKYQLSNKIRHNKSLASFIKKFFDLNKIRSDNLSKNDYKNISFYYTEDFTDAEQYIAYLKALGHEHIYLTPSRVNPEPLDQVKFSSNNSSHQAIGQEYDNVVVVINQHFFYTPALKLSYNANYFYNPLETLFQAITRTRKKLTFVIIDNEEVYKNCIKIVCRD